MEEGKTMEDLDAQMGWLGAMIDDDAVLPSEKMHNLLVTLARVRAETLETAAPFMATIKAQQAKMGEALEDLVTYEGRIKSGLEECLEASFDLENWKFEGEAGTAQIVKPKPRISYDVKGLETLRLSSDPVDRMIGHLRKEAPSKPYLRVKLK